MTLSLMIMSIFFKVLPESELSVITLIMINQNEVFLKRTYEVFLKRTFDFSSLDASY